MTTQQKEIRDRLSDLLELMRRRGNAEFNEHSGITLVLQGDGSGHCHTFYGDEKVFEFNDTEDLIEWLAVPVVCEHCNGTGKHS